MGCRVSFFNLIKILSLNAPGFVMSRIIGSNQRSNFIYIGGASENIFDIYITEYGTALITILPILFLYLNTVIVTAGTFEP